MLPAKNNMLRALDSPSVLPVVRLKNPGLHPLIYRKRLTRVDREAKAGDIVEVRDESDTLAGYGLFNPKSELALRMLSRGEKSP